MKIRRSISSPNSFSSGSSDLRRAAISSWTRSAILSWRSWSIALFFAAAISQAPGLSGMPVRGHCSSAATSASWARSSARATSRTMRVSPAMSRGDSMRQTASIARGVSGAVTAPDHTIFAPRALLLLVLLHLDEPVEMLLRLGREVAELLHLPHLDLVAVEHRRAARPLEGLRLRLHLDH